jgi:hypothetical protein
MTARPKHATAKARDEITNGLCFGCATMKPVRTIELTHASTVAATGERLRSSC